MANDRMATFDQARDAGVDLWNPLVRERAWLDSRAAALRPAAEPPFIFAMIDNERALVATELHDPETMRGRFPRFPFRRLGPDTWASFEREFDYALAAPADDGGVPALMRHRRGGTAADAARISIRLETEGAAGFVDSVTVQPAPGARGSPGAPPSGTPRAATPGRELATGDDGRASVLRVQGWAYREGLGRPRDMAVFLNGAPVGYGRVGSTERPDVVAALGPDARSSGWVVDVSATAEEVERHGLTVFAVFADDAAGEESASQLEVHYLPLVRTSDGTEVLPVSNGRRLPIERSGPDLDGAVDRVERAGGQIVVSGWAADLGDGEAPHQIVLYRDGAFLAATSANGDGPGNSERRVGTGMDRTGFELVAPVDQASAGTGVLRLFAVMGRGAALELSLR